MVVSSAIDEMNYDQNRKSISDWVECQRIT